MFGPLLNQANGVLGQNARSLFYTGRNSGTGIALAHRKLDTKKMLQKNGLPAPLLYATIQSRRELKRFRWTKLPASFVVKPNSAYGGSGILVIFGRNKKGNWVKADKTEIFIPQFNKHVSDILDGSFSSSSAPDIALIEQRIKVHPELKKYNFQGIPDIRIIVYNSIPVMAMLRLTTPESGGRANLHAGGIGVGIDLARGKTTTAVYRSQPIDHLPGSRLPVLGLAIPDWKDILLLAVKAARVSGLNFTGIDIALDREDGPFVLEINSRPGLDIQLANLSPLRTRLRRVEGLNVPSAAKGVSIGRNLFGNEAEQEIEDLTGQTVIGIVETVTIKDQNGSPHQLDAKIDTGAWRTALDAKLARQLGLDSQIIDYAEVKAALGKDRRPIIKLDLNLATRNLKTEAFLADRSSLKYPMIIGRRDLKGFIVDPYKNTRGINDDYLVKSAH